MAFKSKYNGASIEELLEKVNEGLEFYSEVDDEEEDVRSAEITVDNGGVQVTTDVEEGIMGNVQTNIASDLIYLRANQGTVRVSANNFEWNGEQVATVENVPTKTSELENDSGFITSSSVPTKVSALTNDAGYITEEAVEGKQDKLQLYSESKTAAYIDAQNVVLTGQVNVGTPANDSGDLMVYSQTVEMETNQIECNVDKDVGVYADSIKLVTKDKATYNGAEIATVDDTLESYREKYKDTLYDSVKGMFSSIPSYVSFYGAKIMDVEEDLFSSRIRITFNVSGSATYSALYITYQNIVVGTCIYGNARGNFYQSFDLLFRINDGEIYFPTSVYTVNTL